MSEREMGEKERGCMDAAGQLESVAGRLGQIKPIQQQAMAQLLGGYSLAAVARNVKVNRKTLYNWLRRDEKFKAALNSWRNDMARATRARLMGLSGQALKAIQQALAAGDAKVALAIFRGLGILGAEGAGSDDMEEKRIFVRRVRREG